MTQEQPPVPPEPLPPPPAQSGQQGPKNGLAVASMVLGIIGVVMWVFVIPQILAIIFGGVALRQLNRPENIRTGRGMAIAGLVLGIVSLVLLVIFIIAADNTNFYFEVN
ncbi:MAG: DUF4190 domain-containing protein [Acidimicrobiia bacterium]